MSVAAQGNAASCPCFTAWDFFAGWVFVYLAIFVPCRVYLLDFASRVVTKWIQKKTLRTDILKPVDVFAHKMNLMEL